MSISLLTAVPGGGKTSYAVWNVIKEAHEQGKIIYTVGIPKLTIPTIELSYDQVRQWFKTSPNEEGLPELLNIEHGSIIVIDEVQRIWPATGSKISDDIKELSVHRHYGLTFFLITQAPNLIHRNVLALVDRHLHIGVNWAGRKIYEWSEYCRSPSTKTSKDTAVTFNYKLPKESFALYHSATQHVKAKKRAPMTFYIFLVAILLTIVFAYFGVQRVVAKTNPDPEIILSDEKPIEQPVAVTPQPVEPVQLQRNLFDVQLLTHDIDWSIVSACLASPKLGCVCYGASGQRLVVPKESCELAVTSGWHRKKA
ncbi:MAG: zonular occludens toxin domain-containing protein [Nitrosomonas sp.]|uniref:zonular occludens toxin domain-containing protein n=1 Tax=Nitrosomonas sp. TaxID=42353 RepID=UPI002732830D|nr:zonular occludens toxin domain-containing protein [Nitrosomonas sp.]MDP3662064.1 zonular occludens toxin domain-containing protein [Nitrosomonas sp.]MDZ4106493.1 zonular occludens toxin domain-containing protein [Nitrosomonas sp.]